jgi:hypothetical protein
MSLMCHMDFLNFGDGNMKRLVGYLAVPLAITTFASFSGDALAACQRQTQDAGRWRDSMKPSDRLSDMCVGQENYHAGEAGQLILVNPNPIDCKDIINFAKEQESWHGDWWLWSEIKCDRGMRMFIK